MLAYRTAIRMVDVARPFRGVAVTAGSEQWEEVELEVIVRVDQSGTDLAAREVELHTRVHRASRTAGTRVAGSNSSGRPARSKISRSGSPNVASIESRSISDRVRKSSSV